ncbi:MAG: hypothetical protein RIC04_13560 [Parvibaculum sp.]|uniref:hypothetical protein n=1 Tax=Parvibaculum sp. TaxID=2024848 RepID=UPI0032ED3229
MLIESRLEKRLLPHRQRWNDRLFAAHASLDKHLDLWLAGVIVAAVAVQTVLFSGWNEFYEENAPSEMAQNVFLLLASLFFLAAAIADLDRIARLSLYGLALFCFTAFVREVEIEGTALGDVLDPAMRYDLDYMAIVIVALVIVAASFRHLGASVRGALSWLCTNAGRWLLVGVVFYLLGDASEKSLFSSEKSINQMIEETLEQTATMFFLLSATLTFASPTARLAFTGRQKP